MREPLSWPDLFMRLAMDVAQKSKDPNTQCGACVVQGREIVSMGYNGPPSRIKDNVVPWADRDAKQPYIIHAETNAILRAGHRARYATLFVTGIPCSRCMLLIVASGINRVVYGPQLPRVCNEADQALTRLLAQHACLPLEAYHAMELAGNTGRSDCDGLGEPVARQHS